jgi:DNA-binding SARP family transcriptional activator
MAGLRLQLLGRFACESSGSMISLPSGMQRLVAFIALRGPSHRCEVAGSLWPDAPEPRALGNLRTSVWRVNALVQGLLEVHGNGLRMPASAWIDTRVQEYSANCVLASHPAAKEKENAAFDLLCRPVLLPGWYDDWVIFERERLNQLRIHALEVAVRQLTERGQLHAALRLALEAVRAEPLRETANAVLMSVYLAEGNAADAIHHYLLFRDLLKRELDLEPSTRVTELLPGSHTQLRTPHRLLRAGEQ